MPAGSPIVIPTRGRCAVDWRRILIRDYSLVKWRRLDSFARAPLWTRTLVFNPSEADVIAQSRVISRARALATRALQLCRCTLIWRLSTSRFGADRRLIFSAPRSYHSIVPSTSSPSSQHQNHRRVGIDLFLVIVDFSVRFGRWRLALAHLPMKKTVAADRDAAGRTHAPGLSMCRWCGRVDGPAHVSPLHLQASSL